jgi:hypothetical protein
VAPISISGALELTAGGNIGDITAGNAVVGASGDISRVTTTGDADVAGQHIGPVYAGGSISAVDARYPLTAPITAGGDITTVSSAGDISASITAGGRIHTVSAGTWFWEAPYVLPDTPPSRRQCDRQHYARRRHRLHPGDR